ncbi:MAG: ABC transporter substrate-binding protein [Candidatus Desulforudis sp.]|nr:ABC transporter substrate-binding protein [Desulforudis sp.]
MRKKIIAIIMALALLAALVVGCGGQETGPGVAEEEVVKFGSVLSMSGLLGPMGIKMTDAVKLAVEEINAAGGINGKQVQLFIEDDATDPAQCLNAVKKLVEVNGVQFMVTGMSSGAANSVGPYLSERQVLALSPSATSPTLTGESWRDFFFRTTPSDEYQGVVMAQLALDKGLERLAVFTMDNVYGVSLGEVARDALVEGGAEVVGFIKYDPAKLDYRSELTQIKSLNPDGVVHVGYNDDGVVVYQQALELGLDSAQWIGCDGVYGTGLFKTEASATFLANAMIGTRPGAPEGVSEYDTFVAAFQAKYGSDPEVFCDTVYDAVKLFAAAANHAGSEDPAAVRDALREIGQNYQGASGTITFDEGGDRIGGLYEIWNVIKEDGEFKFNRVDMITLE